MLSWLSRVLTWLFLAALLIGLLALDYLVILPPSWPPLSRILIFVIVLITLIVTFIQRAPPDETE